MTTLMRVAAAALSALIAGAVVLVLYVVIALYVTGHDARPAPDAGATPWYERVANIMLVVGPLVAAYLSFRATAARGDGHGMPDAGRRRDSSAVREDAKR